MGITHDQITAAAVKRVRDYSDRIVKLVNVGAPGRHPAPSDRQELDAQALAFAHAITTSDHVHGALGCLCWAMQEAKFLEDDCLPMQLLEAIVRGVAALVMVDGCQRSEINGAGEALYQIERWGEGSNYEEAILYVDDDAWVRWGGGEMSPRSWLGIRKRLDRYVPEGLVARALENMRRK